MDVSKVGGTFSSQEFQNNLQKVKDDEFKDKLKSVMNSKDKSQLKEASKELESVFLNMMLKEMRSSIPKSNLLKSAPGRDMFENMFDQKVAQQISKSEGIGLADMIYEQISERMKNTYKVDE